MTELEQQLSNGIIRKDLPQVYSSAIPFYLSLKPQLSYDIDKIQSEIGKLLDFKSIRIQDLDTMKVEED